MEVTLTPDDAIIELPTAITAEGLPSMPQSPVSKKNKEQRAYRVGLSYACKRCGQPKKGHKCTMPNAPPADGSAAASEVKTAEKKRPVKEQTSPDAADTEGKTEKAPPAKKAKKEVAKEVPLPQTETKEPSQASLLQPVRDDDVVRLAELLEFNHPERPPSLITPEDVEAPDVEAALALSSMSAPPASLTSASNLFSPNQLLTMMGTPAPLLTPHLHFQRGISPGSLNALAGEMMTAAA